MTTLCCTHTSERPWHGRGNDLKKLPRVSVQNSNSKAAVPMRAGRVYCSTTSQQGYTGFDPAVLSGHMKCCVWHCFRGGKTKARAGLLAVAFKPRR